MVENHCSTRCGLLVTVDNHATYKYCVNELQTERPSRSVPASSTPSCGSSEMRPLCDADVHSIPIFQGTAVCRSRLVLQQHKATNNNTLQRMSELSVGSRRQSTTVPRSPIGDWKSLVPERVQPVMQWAWHSKVVSTGWEQLSTADNLWNWSAKCQKCTYTSRTKLNEGINYCMHIEHTVYKVSEQIIRWPSGTQQLADGVEFGVPTSSMSSRKRSFFERRFGVCSYS